MPSRDQYGNEIYSQGEYEHHILMGIPFSGFVDGVGYVLSEVVVTPYPINKSGTHFMLVMHRVQYKFDIKDILDNNKLALTTQDKTDRSNDDESFTSEDLRLALEKSQSYSFNQGNLPSIYRNISKFTSEHDNWAVNIAYNMLSDLFQVVQIVSFGALEREEWYNPFTGTRFGNLNGTPNYEPITGLHTAILMGMPMASKAKDLGYVIPKGMFHIEDIKWGKGIAGKYINNFANMTLGFINGQLSGGRVIIKVKSLAPKEKEYQKEKGINK